MTTVKASRTAVPLPRGTAARRLSVALSSRPRTRLGLLLSAPSINDAMSKASEVARTLNTVVGHLQTYRALDNDGYAYLAEDEAGQLIRLAGELSAITAAVAADARATTPTE